MKITVLEVLFVLLLVGMVTVSAFAHSAPVKWVPPHNNTTAPDTIEDIVLGVAF